MKNPNPKKLDAGTIQYWLNPKKSFQIDVSIKDFSNDLKKQNLSKFMRALYESGLAQWKYLKWLRDKHNTKEKEKVVFT